MRRNGPLLIAWLITIAMFAAGMYTGTAWAVLAQFGAMALAGITVARTERMGELRRPWLYRAALVLLLGAVGTVLVAAGSTVVVGHGGQRIAGFIALATTNLVAAILTWRALTRPAPRRAAIVGLIAVIAELFALIADVLINIRRPGTDSAMIVALLASFAATWAGALVSIASLISFEPAGMVQVPDARVVDGD